jgi:hypothetical protein
VSWTAFARENALSGLGDHQPRFAGTDGTRCGSERVQPRSAQAIESGARHIDRQAGEQAGHARDVAVVLPGLVGAAEQNLVDGGPVHGRVACDQGAQRDRRKVVGAHRRQRAAVTTEGCALRVADEGLWCHVELG